MLLLWLRLRLRSECRDGFGAEAEAEAEASIADIVVATAAVNSITASDNCLVRLLYWAYVTTKGCHTSNLPRCSIILWGLHQNPSVTTSTLSTVLAHIHSHNTEQQYNWENYLQTFN